MKKFRAVLFWTHLCCGLIAGIVIGIMCFTGAILAFEVELTEWAERDARRVNPVGKRLSLAEMTERLRAAEPIFQPNSVIVRSDPSLAVAFSAGRGDNVFVDPHSGAVRRPASTAMYRFMRVVTDWHRYLALAGDNRPYGKLVTGVCNLAFLGLAVTGLYLWWPRGISWRSIKAVAVFNARLTGRARDFNWHNSIGLWMAPILIVLTATAVPISFRWGTNLIHRLTGEEFPVATAPAAAPAIEITPPAGAVKLLGLDGIVASVGAALPRWQQITLRMPDTRRGDSEGGGSRPSATSVTVREAGSWPRTATTTLALDPFTGAIVQRSGYAELPASRQVRAWTRFLHTGQALGWPGQLVAGLACLAGLLLIYTGFALSFRRFFGKRSAAPRVSGSLGE